MRDETKKEAVGVILLNLGGPDSLQAVRLFLYNLFSDRQIIQLGPLFLQRPLARLIAAVRYKKTEKSYSLIGGKSPILDITMAQADALEKALNQKPPHRIQTSGLTFKVYVGMRYWHPFIEEVAPEIYNDGIRKLIALSLYPHYSRVTVGSSLLRLNEAISGYPVEILCISSWSDHPLYIEALVDLIKKGFESFTPSVRADSDPRGVAEEYTHVLFSAHNLPQKIADEGDPYVCQIMGTIGEITKRIPIKSHLSYQSKSGPVKWLKPSTDEKLKELAGEGVKNILVVPISFVSDHIETLYEIDILYKGTAEKLGINLKRTESLNTHPTFIKALEDIVIKNIKKAGWA